MTRLDGSTSAPAYMQANGTQRHSRSTTLVTDPRSHRRAPAVIAVPLQVFPARFKVAVAPGA